MIAGEKGKALIARMPRDRILTETDGPFATVHGRNALPWDVEKAIIALAVLWKTERDEVAHMLDSNLRDLLSMK